MKQPKVIVSGANGQLGKEFRALQDAYPDLDLHCLGKENFSIDQFEMVRNVFEALRPDALVNCAAYTAVDKAESQQELADLINGEAVGHLAALCQEFGTRFIHISTDYVFNGQKNGAYKEDDPVDPVNYYGASKLKGEQLALQQNKETLIIRTSWVYSVHGSNFVRTMMRLMEERSQLNVVSDQKGSPTHAADLAEAILQVLQQHLVEGAAWHPGIYHFSNAADISWYDFAVAIKEITGSTCELQPIPTSSYPTPAKRPANSLMDKSKFEHTFGIAMKPWKESLQRCINSM